MAGSGRVARYGRAASVLRSSSRGNKVGTKGPRYGTRRTGRWFNDVTWQTGSVNAHVPGSNVGSL